jgi:hypothetical protein
MEGMHVVRKVDWLKWANGLTNTKTLNAFISLTREIYGYANSERRIGREVITRIYIALVNINNKIYNTK